MSHEIISLRKNSSELRSILFNGKVSKHGETWRVLPREVVSPRQEPSLAGSASKDPLNSSFETVVLELTRSKEMLRPSWIKVAAIAIRPETLTLSVAPAVCVMILGLSKGWTFSWAMALLSLLGMVCFHLSVNLLTDVEDFLRLVDLPGTFGGNRVIQKGWVSPRQMKLVGYVIFCAGLVLGLPVIFQSSKSLTLLLEVSALALLGMVSFSTRPIGLKYQGWGDVLVFFLLGPLLTLGVSVAVFDKLESSVILLGIFFGLLAWASTHAGNMQRLSQKFDRSQESGATTFAQYLGFKASRHFLVCLYVVAYLFLGLGFWSVEKSGGIATFLCGCILLGFPLLFRFLQKVYLASGPASALLSTLKKDTLYLHATLGVLLSLGLLLARSLMN